MSDAALVRIEEELRRIARLENGERELIREARLDLNRLYRTMPREVRMAIRAGTTLRPQTQRGEWEGRRGEVE